MPFEVHMAMGKAMGNMPHHYDTAQVEEAATENPIVVVLVEQATWLLLWQVREWPTKELGSGGKQKPTRVHIARPAPLAVGIRRAFADARWAKLPKLVAARECSGSGDAGAGKPARRP